MPSIDEILIDCSHCRIRNWQREDLASLLHHANNPRVAQWLRHRFPHPYTEAVGKAWLEQATCPPFTDWAIEVDGLAVGGIGFASDEQGASSQAIDPQRSDSSLGPVPGTGEPGTTPREFPRSVEIGYWVGEDYWGRGIGTAAVIGFTTFLLQAGGVESLFALVMHNNDSSRRVLEKAGFEADATLRQRTGDDQSPVKMAVYSKTQSAIPS